MENKHIILGILGTVLGGTFFWCQTKFRNAGENHFCKGGWTKKLIPKGLFNGGKRSTRRHKRRSKRKGKKSRRRRRR